MTAAGLTSAEAEARLEAEGPNLLPAGERRGTFAIALEVLREPMFLLLVAGALIYLLLGDVREALVLVASIVVVVVKRPDLTYIKAGWHPEWDTAPTCKVADYDDRI